MNHFIVCFILICNYAGLSQNLSIQNRLDQPKEIAVFIGLDCPISQKYISRLNEIYDQYKNKPDHKWTFIVPEAVSKKRVNNFIKEFNVKFPLQSDNSMLLSTKHFGAQLTPQVVIKMGDEIIYKGAIDNWFYELGRYRLVVTEHYLIDALESVLKNEYPKIRETETIGCFIQTHEVTDHQH